MEARRNALLAEMARDAELERSDFLVRAGEQLERFITANHHRIQQLGGLVLIDDDPDYLAVTADGMFRSRSRVYDEGRGEWISEMEVIETAGELVEIYNPADILQAFADAQTEDIGLSDREPGPTDGGEGDAAAHDDAYAAAADQWAAGQPEAATAKDEAGAAVALYELALDFQDRSQRTESGLIEQFENAAAGVLGLVDAVVVVDDEDEHLELAVGGFRGRVIPEGGTGWQDISSPDQIVRYYDPTDIFGDLAEALVDQYPAVSSADAGDQEDTEDVEDADGAEDSEDKES
jgi:hypothetical protein